MTKKRFALLFALGWICISSFAQGDADTLPAPVTLPQCIAYALQHQPLVQQAAIDEEITERNIRSRLADWLPQIGAGYTVQHNFQRQTSFFNGVATPVGVNNLSTGQLYLNQSIFNRDLLLARRSAGDLRENSSEATTARKIDVVAAVRKAFYDILATEQQIRVASENIIRLQKSISDAFYRYESGVTDKTDYKRAQITLNNVVAGRRTNEAAVAAKTENLKALMGYPSEYTLQISYDTTMLERDARFDTTQVPNPGLRIEYRQLQTQKRLQESNVLYQRNAFLPTVSANAIYNLNYANNSFGKLYGSNFPNSFIGLSAGIPIFQGGKRRENIRAAQLAVQRIDLDLRNLSNQINNQYAAALNNYKASMAGYRAATENIALAREVYDVIQLQYKAGIKTYLEVITAETDLRTAEINYYNALYQLVANKVDAERALGLIADR